MCLFNCWETNWAPHHTLHHTVPLGPRSGPPLIGFFFWKQAGRPTTTPHRSTRAAKQPPNIGREAAHLFLLLENKLGAPTHLSTRAAKRPPTTSWAPHHNTSPHRSTRAAKRPLTNRFFFLERAGRPTTTLHHTVH